MLPANAHAQIERAGAHGGQAGDVLIAVKGPDAGADFA